MQARKSTRKEFCLGTHVPQVSCTLKSQNSNDMQETLYRILKGACPRDSRMRAGQASSLGWLLTRDSMLTLICCSVTQDQEWEIKRGSSKIRRDDVTND